VRNYRLDGKIMAVAGATGAIGRAACSALLDHGATVIALGRDARKLARLREDLQSSRDRLHILLLDGIDEHSWRTLLDYSDKRHGGIDGFIHTAGLVIPGAFLELTLGEITSIVRTNFESVVSAAYVLIPDMMIRRRGHFIAVGSLGGIVPMPYETMYSASKFALRGFCLSLHEEVRGSGVTVTLVSPGPVRSPMLHREGSDPRAALTFVDRPMEPETVAAAIIRLLQCRKREVVCPPLQRPPAMLVGLFPGIFGALFPALRKVGQYKLARYRRTLSHSQDHGHGNRDQNIQAA
jgi:3-oxoacyl-[acyl-carrier protein] reductase